MIIVSGGGNVVTTAQANSASFIVRTDSIGTLAVALTALVVPDGRELSLYVAASNPLGAEVYISYSSAAVLVPATRVTLRRTDATQMKVTNANVVFALANLATVALQVMSET